jgi:hypothetical protein
MRQLDSLDEALWMRSVVVVVDILKCAVQSDA